MELYTPQAIHKIKSSKQRNIIVDGHKSSHLQAMAFAINYHKLDVKEFGSELLVSGTDPVIRLNDYLIK
ncbi:MAG: hypothetical protein COB35_10460 [Gammaproteobacteria bacterium]|nr:MAG: hypothetical protein COB35_10460 [Gammaproteobacteria bacterium]